MLTLSVNIPAQDVIWVSVGCRKFSVDFGSVMVPQDFTPLETQRTFLPKGRKGPEPMAEAVHGIQKKACTGIGTHSAVQRIQELKNCGDRVSRRTSNPCRAASLPGFSDLSVASL